MQFIQLQVARYQSAYGAPGQSSSILAAMSVRHPPPSYDTHIHPNVYRTMASLLQIDFSRSFARRFLLKASISPHANFPDAVSLRGRCCRHCFIDVDVCRFYINITTWSNAGSIPISSSIDFAVHRLSHRYSTVNTVCTAKRFGWSTHSFNSLWANSPFSSTGSRTCGVYPYIGLFGWLSVFTLRLFV